MRRFIGVVLMLTMLAAVSACRNTYASGGSSSNSGGNGTIHTGIPF
jgi:predicted small secreted protein